MLYVSVHVQFVDLLVQVFILPGVLWFCPEGIPKMPRPESRGLSSDKRGDPSFQDWRCTLEERRYHRPCAWFFVSLIDLMVAVSLRTEASARESFGARDRVRRPHPIFSLSSWITSPQAFQRASSVASITNFIVS
jgi:hypothetical protein